jgi:hypothetical protein
MRAPHTGCVARHSRAHGRGVGWGVGWGGMRDPTFERRDPNPKQIHTPSCNAQPPQPTPGSAHIDSQQLPVFRSCGGRALAPQRTSRVPATKLRRREAPVQKGKVTPTAPLDTGASTPPPSPQNTHAAAPGTTRMPLAPLSTQQHSRGRVQEGVYARGTLHRGGNLCRKVRLAAAAAARRRGADAGGDERLPRVQG